jgi:hypothetical protein
MKYSDNTVPKSLGQLRDAMTFTLVHAYDNSFPDWCGLDLDGAFHRLFLGIENLRRRFGDSKADQLLDMLQQAKTHFVAGEGKLGSWLMQDAEEVVSDRRPFAYPRELYRWPIDPDARAVEPADLEKDASEE